MFVLVPKEPSKLLLNESSMVTISCFVELYKSFESTKHCNTTLEFSMFENLGQIFGGPTKNCLVNPNFQKEKKNQKT